MRYIKCEIFKPYLEMKIQNDGYTKNTGMAPFKKYSELDEAEIVSSTSSKPPRDWDFMKESKMVLENVPDTWKAYPQNIQGGMSIISMEYEELMKAPAEERMHELVHLASACLHLWRMYNDSK